MLMRIKNIKKGFALPLVLFTLLGISLIAAVSVKLSMIDQNLGLAETDRGISKQMAELALVDAIDDITCLKKMDGSDNLSDDRVFDKTLPFDVADNACLKGICGKTDINAPIWTDLQSADKSSLNFAEYGDYTGKNAFGNDIQTGTIKLPRYIIESIETKFPKESAGTEYFFRITAVGYGRFSSNTFTKLQIVYRSKNQLCGYNSSYTRPSVSS